MTSMPYRATDSRMFPQTPNSEKSRISLRLSALCGDILAVVNGEHSHSRHYALPSRIGEVEWRLRWREHRRPGLCVHFARKGTLMAVDHSGAVRGRGSRSGP
jgi:hypothetical protein